jgi:hypothetical protein
MVARFNATLWRAQEQPPKVRNKVRKKRNTEPLTEHCHKRNAKHLALLRRVRRVSRFCLSRGLRKPESRSRAGHFALLNPMRNTKKISPIKK